jgi:putative transposase
LRFSKMSQEVWPDIKTELGAIRDAANYKQGLRLAKEFIEKYEKEYPSLVKAFEKDLEALLAHLKFPVAHRKSIRTTNLIERSFEEERRRSKVIPKFLTEKGALKLVCAVLTRSSARWRRIKMTEKEKHQLRLIRESLGISENKEEALV